MRKVGLVLLVACMGAWSGCKSENAEPPKTFGLTEKAQFEGQDVVYMAGTSSVKVMLNLFKFKDALEGSDEAKRTSWITQTSIDQAKIAFAKDQYKEFKKVEVQLVYLSKYDEYGAPDYSSLKKKGSVLLSKSSEAGSLKIEKKELLF